MTNPTAHSEGSKVIKKERYLWIALFLTLIFALVELIGGLMFGSLALLSDAAHMFTDVASLVIALTAIQIGKRVADVKRTFGYYRFEILAAVLNALILLIVAIYIFYEAYKRFFSPTTVEPAGMLVIAMVGLVVNLIAIRLLHQGSKESLNVRGAYLEAWADMLGSVGVIIAAIVIFITGQNGIDSIIAIAIGLWVIPRSWSLLKAGINILLEGVPDGIELTSIHNALAKILHVTNVHDLHIWAVTSGKVSLTVHLVIDDMTTSPQSVLETASALLASQFNITHATIQIETKNCGHDDLDRASHLSY